MSLEDVAVAAGSAVAEEPITGAGDGTGGGAPESVPESLPVESPEQQQPEQQQPEQVVEQPEQPVVEGQPVPLPKELRALMADKELAQNPLVAAAVKTLQSTFDRLNAYTTHFPTVADAKKFAESFPGGLQDALAAQAKAQEAIDSDNAYYSRDPKQVYDLTSTWQQDDPEAYRVMAHEGLMVLMDKDPEGYRSIMLENLEGSLVQMQQQALLRKDTAMAEKIADVHEGIFGRKPGEAPRVDPRDAQHRQQQEALQRQREEFSNTVASNFMETNNNQAGSRVLTSIRGMVDKALANVKLTQPQKDRLYSDIYSDIDSKLRADKSLQNQIVNIVSSGKRAGKFTREDGDRYINAIYAKAQTLLRTSGPQFINNWTATFLNLKRADTQKREAAGARTDLTGGGSPNLGVGALTGDKMLDMSDEQIRNYKGPIDPKWRTQMREARLSRGI